MNEPKPVLHEPVLLAATVSGVIIALAAKFDIVLDTGVTETIVAAVLPVFLALFARANVRPVAK